MLPLGIHPGFLLILLIIVLIVFGPGKLPELGSAIGRGIREFRKESDKIVDEVRSSGTEKESPPAAPAEVRPTETRPTVVSDTPATPTEPAKAETER
ncbi:MAG: twin-arginine translocase TatA/TatE family subunit [Candidatus Nephthysia bennettiae]|uniref:Sec-independent protein translocase protein TatA n=1 Tax=Candidatus Nephthysia bennettiae TaxID=3127016 RepID=A0A934K4D0_9BACT|nr:twin-arginine translocase TatA/TatE family subunit [Candidatus Dormibacteraeota bacterium]MBJ7613553.1 twin-arginine translocase TatA/TatE family subunit [Candidatus Dormibacteraeota bacterium]PZR87367.1 MAG: twin-arginine translocase TatA/TatE family subunit [Candidatus Dormibacteraeota bacterium]